VSRRQSCKRLGNEPFAYLRDVFDRVCTHSTSRIDVLSPDRCVLTWPDSWPASLGAGGFGLGLSNAPAAGRVPGDDHDRDATKEMPRSQSSVPSRLAP
jgi:hypothetical protein